jgi:hypothetical protein
MTKAFSARDVLDDLDHDASPRRAAFFPNFDHGYNFHVDQRLSAYADDARWVLVIEQLAVNPRSWKAGIHTTVYYHGTGIVLPPQPGWKDIPVQRVTVLEDGPSGPLLEADSCQDVNLKATDVTIRGQVVPIRTDPNYYWARKIEVPALTNEKIDGWIAGLNRLPPDVAEHARRNYEEMRSKVGKFRLQTWHLARGLVPEYRDVLLATEAERRLGVAAELKLLLQIDEWDHPRLLDGELPRSSDAFKSIAKVFAHGDPSLYCPPHSPNTHWSNWPRSGSL